MSIDRRPRLASLAAIKEALTSDTPDKGRAPRLRILTRHPDRYHDYRPMGWSIDVAWCSPRPGQGRLMSTKEAVTNDLIENTTKATAYIIDVLDIHGPSTDDVARWLIHLDDISSQIDADVYVLIDEGAHAPHERARWASILPRITAQRTTTDDVEEGGPTFADKQISSTETESREDEPESNQLRHLTRLPVGFSLDALRRRILQWRRMGFDVSDLEAALMQSEEQRERTYRHVEDCVRRAVDLDRRLTLHKDEFSATELEHNRFRLRQLTGLDDIESKFQAQED